MLGACATGDAALPTGTTAAPPSAWKIRRGFDRIAGHEVTTAFVVARASTTTELFARPVGLQLMCFKGAPIVRFGFDVRVGANRSAAVGYRFDGKAGHETVKARFLPDFRTVIVEDRAEVAAFVDDLATSDVLFMRVSSLYAGATNAEFHVSGAPAALEAAYADCPLAPAQPARHATAKKR
jgi:hypothetical protein